MSLTTRSRRLAAGLSLALAASLLPAGVASADHIETHGTDDACAGAPEDGFVDTGPDGSAQEEAVDCIAWYGITGGTTQTTYSPTRSITRAQMATMIAESMRRSETPFAEPTQDEDAFADDDGSVHEGNIDFVAKHGVVRGTAADRYSPQDPVTRAQMATFIVNQLDAIGADLPQPSQDYFDDDDGSVHEGNINVLAELGIATGRTDRGYEPTSPVTRGQMALFISRDLDELVDQGLMVTPDKRATVTVDQASVPPGGTITGSITAEKDITSATASGCGLNNEKLEDTDTSKAGIQFSETIPTSQPAGECTLTFTVRFADGSTDEVQKTITVSGQAATVVLDRTSVPAGGKLTGSITSTSKEVSSATLSGCGFTNEKVEDTDNAKAGIQFSETVPATQPPGSCELTFTVTFGDGSKETVKRTITVTTQPTVTAAPELVSVSVVDSTSDPVRVKFTFDEAVTTAITPGNFHLYTFAASQVPASSAARDSQDTSSVVARFPKSGFQDATVAAVANKAVQDGEGNFNPEGSAALGGTRTLAAGTTDAPDLRGVGDITRVNATTVEASYLFDEAPSSPTVDATKFHLVLDDGSVYDGQTRKSVSGNTVRVELTGEQDVQNQPARRGYVEADAVQDSEGDGNPQQAEPVTGSDGSTDTPDLRSITLKPDANQVVYTFDESVDLTAGSLTEPTSRKFRIYYVDGTEETADSVSEGPDNLSVTATFGSGEVNALVVGASVDADAVRSNRPNGPTNRVDERGVASTIAAGRTAGPDLVSVTKEQPNATTLRFVFTFDQAVDFTADSPPGSEREFVVYDADGSRHELPERGVQSGCARDGNDPSKVVCTVSSQDNATTFNNVEDSVLGAVEHRAVNDTSSADRPNPESSDPF